MDTRAGYYDEEGHWIRTKYCFVSCGARCDCGPPFGQYIKPGSPADLKLKEMIVETLKEEKS